MSKILANIAGVDVREEADSSLTFVSNATIDGDGANGQFGGPPCYAPDTYQYPVLDFLANAGTTGNWWGIVVDKMGNPVLQSARVGDPSPGAYISTTSLVLPHSDGLHRGSWDPFKYVDSYTVPYIAIPKRVLSLVPGIILGCKCLVTWKGRSVIGVVADIGSNSHIGEVSVAMAARLGMPLGSGRHLAGGGGEDKKIVKYQIFPGTEVNIDNVSYPLQRS